VNEFAEWDSFYLIIGGAAGALIGLQFVVLTLIADRGRPSPEAGSAFSTPTVIQFSVVLFLSAFIRVPWTSVLAPSIIGAVVGGLGTAYVTQKIIEIKKQDVYDPVWEDWLFHAILPLAAYVTLLISAFVAIYNTRAALFAGAAATLTLLFTAIHNAWDAVTWHVFAAPADVNKNRRSQSKKK
jgi:hypothetical protein